MRQIITSPLRNSFGVEGTKHSLCDFSDPATILGFHRTSDASSTSVDLGGDVFRIFVVQSTSCYSSRVF